MKIINTATMIMVVTALFVSCNNDDTASVNPAESGDLELFFDNGVAGDALILGNTYTNSNNESLTIDRFNYIVSNIELIAEDGTTYTYPKESSYFVVSQEAGLHTAHLQGVPAGNYRKIRFGIGVDRQRYLQGETAQQSFWDLAVEHHLTWTWSTGYRFITFEGEFTGPSIANPLVFQVHQGSTSATDNYRQVTLDLPVAARVRKGDKPTIHILADTNVLLDGGNKIILSENLNGTGTAASVMGGENLVKIAQNSLKMFTVDHVHNGSGNHE